jgi:hypothetical protein
MDALYPGCAAPISTVVIVSSPSLDISAAVAARIKIRLPDDSIVDLPGVISGLSATGCTVTREHEVDDIPEGSEGSARVWAELDIGADAALVTSSHSISILAVGR